MSSSSSTTLIWLQPLGISQTCFGCSLFIINTIAGTLILITMRRRNVTFIMVGTMILVDAIYGLGVFLQGSYALIIDANYGETASTVMMSDWYCTIRPKNLILVFTAPLIALLPWSLSVERLLAVFWPIKYQIHGRSYSFGLIALAIVASLAWLIGTLVDNYLSEEMVPLTCGLNMVWDSLNRRILSAFRIVLTTLDVVAYIPILWEMKKKVKILVVVNSTTQDNKNTKDTVQHIFARKLNRSAALNAVNTFLLFQIPDIYFFVYGGGANLGTLIFSAMLASRGMVSTLIFVIGNDEVREAVFRKIRFLSSSNDSMNNNNNNRNVSTIGIAGGQQRLPSPSSIRSQIDSSLHLKMTPTSNMRHS